MSSEIGFMRRMNQTAPLLMTLILTATACTTGAAPTEASWPTTTEQAAVQTPTPDVVDLREPSSGDHPSALEWTEADLSGTTFIDQLLVTDRGFIVYRLYEDPQAWVSENGINWTEADLDFGTANHVDLSNITAGVPGYLALGSTSDTDQVLWTSKDGLEWESHRLDLEKPAGDFEGFHRVIAFEEGLLLEGSFLERYEDDEGEGHGHSVVLAYSENGINWVVLPGNETLFGPGAQVSDFTSTGRGVVATGYVEGPDSDGERFWWSSDGRTWEESPTDFLNESGFPVEPGIVRWGDQILTVVNTAEGVRLWTSTEGRDWAQLPASPALDHTDEFDFEVFEVAAGPLGIVLLGQLVSPRQPMPPVIIEKDGLILTFELETGRVIVADQVTGDLLFETDFFGDADVVLIDEEDGTVTIFDPDTEEELASFTFDEFEEAQLEAFEEAGIEGPGDGEPQSVSVLLFSPDGRRWASVRTEEIIGYEGFPIDVKVGNDAVILRWFDPSEFQADTEEEPAEIPDDLPDIIWVGRLAEGQ